MKNALRSALLVTCVTLVGHIVLFATQVMTASYFGASAEMDAYLAASTLPTYIVTVLLGSIGYSFIPIFVDYKNRNLEARAYELALNLLNFCLLVLGAITLIGVVFARPLMLLTAPGLTSASIDLAVKVAIVTWPTILASGPLYLFSSLYQADKKFLWQAVVPLIGAVITLILLLLLGRRIGVLGLAIASTAGVILQLALFKNGLFSKVKYRLSFDWKDPDVTYLLRLGLPLIAVAVITKLTPVVDRYFASGFNLGSVSQLNYAYKMVTVIASLISVGGSTVIFPRMALDVANKDNYSLRNTFSKGLKLMWLLIAPIIAIGYPLARPMVSVLLERGQFGASDAQSVASMLQIYLFSLTGMALGNVTSRCFYVLKETKIIAVIGIVEALAYVAYTFWLTRTLGLIGIALSCVIYFNLSISWQIFVLNRKTRDHRVKSIFSSYIKTVVSAFAAGWVTYWAANLIETNLLKIVVGGLAGLVTYLSVLRVAGSEELVMFSMLFPKWKTER